MNIRRSVPSLLATLSVAGCFVVAAPATYAGESAPALRLPALVAQAAPSPEPAAGMTIYIDPATGAILQQPAPGSVPLQLPQSVQGAASTSTLGLVQVPSAAPGGGVKLDLRGRFQSPLIVTVDANGKVVTQHLGEAPENLR